MTAVLRVAIDERRLLTMVKTPEVCDGFIGRLADLKGSLPGTKRVYTH